MPKQFDQLGVRPLGFTPIQKAKGTEASLVFFLHTGAPGLLLCIKEGNASEGSAVFN